MILLNLQTILYTIKIHSNMKRNIISMLFLFGIHLYTEAQISYETGSPVYTCNGGSIATLIANRELTTAEKADLRAQLLSGSLSYLGIAASDIIEEASSLYNCHAYTWHLTEGNTNKVWINQTQNESENLSKYWSDGCFIEVLETDATKIFYYNGDHSAVKSTSYSGKYESKWGQFPLVRHHPIQVPYNYPNARKYYIKNNFISGPDYICPNSSVTYTINNKPSDATITWTSGMTLTGANNTTSNNATFNYGSHAAPSYIYDATGHPIDYYNNQISATIHLSSGTDLVVPVKRIKEPEVSRGIYTQYGVPTATNRICSTSNPYLPDSDHRWIAIELHADPNITYSWSIASTTSTYPIPQLYTSNNGNVIEFQHSGIYTYELTVSASCCGTTKSFVYGFYPYGGGSSGVDCTSAYNPGTGILEISFETSTSKQTQAVSKTAATYTILLYDIYGNKIKEGRSSGETFVWNLSSLRTGIYIVSVRDNNNEPVYSNKFNK
jgi:hypothetical protein